MADFPAVIELSSLDGGNGFQVNGAGANDYAIYSVTSAGDVNGDGIDDFIRTEQRSLQENAALQ